MARTVAVADDVHAIDLELLDTEVLSAYLIDDGEPTLIESGSAATVGTLLSGVRDAGVDPADLAHVVISHVHLDHSGGAAALAERAPGIDVHIHESTGSYLVDPGRLIESTREAMGEQFHAFGAPDPLPEAALAPVPDGGATVDVGRRSLELLHVPGHSPDHVAAWVPETGRLFATESFGAYFPKAARWLPPATVPHFDPDAVRSTIERLRALDPDEVVLSHFGPLEVAPEAAFDAAEAVLADLDERILELFERHGDVEATIEAVREEVLGLDDGYDPQVGEMYAPIITRGYLRHHDLA